MISGADIYTVLAAVIPLYVAMILAYGSVKWWKIFTPDQCAGINRFVAVFAVPLLSFHFISTNDPYAMNFPFVAADSLQKILILTALGLWAFFSKKGTLDWLITLFSLSTLPNTLVMGIPLLRAMYGDYSASLMVQIVVMQSLIWYTLMLFLFEFRGAKILITEQFPETAASITSFKVDSDILSLDGREPLQADAEIGEDGKLHVTVRKSSASRSAISAAYNNNNNRSLNGMTTRVSNLTGVEIYSLQSSREPTPRGSGFNNNDFYAVLKNMQTSAGNFYNGFMHSPRQSNFQAGDHIYSVNSSKVPTPRTSNFDEDMVMRLGRTTPTTIGNAAAAGRRGTQPHQDVVLPSGKSKSSELGKKKSNSSDLFPALSPIRKSSTNTTDQASAAPKELHMFVWSSSASPISEANLHHAANKKATVGSDDFGAINDAKSKGMQESSGDYRSPARKTGGVDGEAGLQSDQVEIIEGDQICTPNGKMTCHMNTSTYGDCLKKNLQAPCNIDGVDEKATKNTQLPPVSVMTRLILIMVWRKLIRNPNTYSSILGLVWSLVSFRWNIRMPTIIQGSISILSDAGLGMAMFSLGLFMALQPRIIACGKSVAAFAMAVRFLTGPAVMTATSIAIGLRGVLLHVAIVQAALPQGIVPFVFAKEYSLHADILSTAVIFGMLIALPITILYYVFLQL